MEQLIKRWEEEYLKLVDKAEQYRNTNEHNFKKLTYKALQLKYCIKDLREQCAINGVVEQSEQLKAFDDLFDYAWNLVQFNEQYEKLNEIKERF